MGESSSLSSGNWGGSSDGNLESSTTTGSGWGELPKTSNSEGNMEGNGWLPSSSGEDSGGNGSRGSGNNQSDGWQESSLKQGHPRNDKAMWDGEESGRQSPGGLVMGSSRGEVKQNGMNSKGISPSSNGISSWGANKSPGDMMGNNWNIENSGRVDGNHVCSPPSDDNSNMSGGDGSSNERGKQEMGAEWEWDKASLSSNEHDTRSLPLGQDGNRPVATSPAFFSSHDYSSLENSRNSSRNETHPSGNFSSSYDGNVITSDSMENLGGFESSYMHASPRNGAGTPIQGVHSGGRGTPTQSNRTAEGGGENCWRRKVGSTSSLNSVGSGSSWKGSGGETRNGGAGNFQSKTNSPRKSGR